MPERRIGKLAAAAASLVVVGCANAYADVTISTAQTQNMSCANGVCAPTATSAVLNVGDLETLLASANVEVTTTGSNGIQADNIDVDAALTWSSTSSFALDAYQSITVGQAISVANKNAVSLTTDDGGSGGLLSFGSQGSMSFANLSSPLTINGTSYTLVNTVKTLASAIASNPSGAYAFASNYDASQDGTYSTCPIEAELEGTLQGLGSTISKLAIKAKSVPHQHAGTAFLESVGTTGAVENLRLTAIKYGGAVGGGLAVINYGYVFGDEVTGSIKSYGGTGGLLRANVGTVVASSADVTVRVHCCRRAVAGVGGLVATNEGTIELSRARGDISGSVRDGGLASANYGTISQSYATGNLDHGGGLVYTDLESGTITNSYATGAVGGFNSAGFLQNENDQTTGTISDSYSTGAVSAQDESGGFACVDGDTFSNDYWDITTSGTTFSACNDLNAPGITGLSNKKLKSGLPKGFDPSIWAEQKGVNNGLPYLIANPPPQ